ncbi:MAG: hypothetical protein K2M09_03735 [Muribaculaceae bacterium]|nr:hypothetical protein [Bacteroides sp.]MDE6262400.1 hypothetical protein [Muribaculaceae bacterium]
MYNYRVAFIVNGKQLNAWFSSPLKFSEENKSQIREMAVSAVQEYLTEVRSIPKTGTAEALAIWPEILSSNGVIQPLDAFEIKDL